MANLWIIYCYWLVVEEKPLWKILEFVNWDDDIPSTWKNESHVPNHQQDGVSPMCFRDAKDSRKNTATSHAVWTFQAKHPTCNMPYSAQTLKFGLCSAKVRLWVCQSPSITFIRIETIHQSFPVDIPPRKKQINWLVVSTPLKNMKVSLDDYSRK